MSPCLLFPPGCLLGPLGDATQQATLHAAKQPGCSAPSEQAGAHLCSSWQSESAAWCQPLLALAAAPVVSRGSPAELAAYAGAVRGCILASLHAAQRSTLWSGSGLIELLARSLALLDVGRASVAREQACSCIGFAQLASQLASQGKLQGTGSAAPATSDAGTESTLSDQASASGLFKVPRAKRARGEDSSLESSVTLLLQLGQQQQQQQPLPSQQQPPPPQQQTLAKRRPPPRRLTPQVLSCPPVCLTPAALPASASEACCDAQLLSAWCCSGGRTHQQQQEQEQATHGANPADTCSSDASCSSSSTRSPPASPALARQQQRLASSPDESPSAGSSCTAAGSPPPAQQGPAQLARSNSISSRPPPLAPPPPPAASGSGLASQRAGAADALRRLLHEPPAASRPAAEALLFGPRAAQHPVVTWKGCVKHKEDGRVAEVCSLSLQVPQAYSEEFPAALYAGKLRHRRAVSLGRHVVCRASLGALSEHQLAALAAMARDQLVALCLLQTAELHLVPYFDNRSLVRVVGFLKIASDA